MVLDLITIVVTSAYLVVLLCGETFDSANYMEGVKRSLSGQRVVRR